MGPVIGSLKSPCTTSYRWSIDTIALNCLVFEKIAFLYFGDRQRQTDRQTTRQANEQTNRWTGPMQEAALAVANGGLISLQLILPHSVVQLWLQQVTVFESP